MPKFNRKIVQVAQSMADLTQGIAITPYGRFFDGAACFENPAITHVNLEAIPVEDRPKLLPLLIEFMAVQEEKRRRKVRFLPAQVIRRIKAALFADKPGFRLIFAGSDISEYEKVSDEQAASILANTNDHIFLKMAD